MTSTFERTSCQVLRHALTNFSVAFAQKFGICPNQGGWRVNMPQKFLRPQASGACPLRTRRPLPTVSTALESLRSGLSNAHLMSNVPLVMHFVSDIKCTTVPKPKMQGLQAPKTGYFEGILDIHLATQVERRVAQMCLMRRWNRLT